MTAALAALIVGGGMGIGGGPANDGPGTGTDPGAASVDTGYLPGKAEAGVAAAVRAALALDAFPELTPSLEELGTEAWVAAVNKSGCPQTGPETLDRCRGGSPGADRTVVVLGDSSAVSWLPGIEEAAKAAGWETVPLTLSQCPAAGVSVTHEGGQPYPECDEHREWAVQEINRMKPDLVVLSDSEDSLTRLVSGSSNEAAAQLTSGLVETIGRINDAAGAVVVLGPAPAGKDLRQCMAADARPEDCISKASVGWRNMQEVTGRAAAETGAEFVDVGPWFCGEDGRCPAFVASIAVRMDTTHMSTDYSRFLAPVLAERVLSNPPSGRGRQ
ncbi:hypothetical protein MUK71_05175 [Arthrobacter zhangbolii]|uniref:SGNH domain-containing protein n=1 Tax=Arthrobacter zhangbolii TaxID=2886936 RepID=A0A9X1SBJ9_9MICC|nr:MULTISPECIES: SGNH hydrolase domain-containing protein [Arthrobacter]MCC3272969.1 hypothetical protein [Arthrobacter zhangbolii]MDN3905257.1 SGNH hydrolase domain-containing protein [Arthrobacter sp. YD2]UON93018.1 hypothetical protein MUK71_05175 [Arthrobacter zhangbolii]